MEPAPRGLRTRLWNPYLVVFVSSACIMVLELVASRLIAPTLGVSLYTWTSVIGVILAGMSLGNYVGGRLADRYGSTTLLGKVFALGALGSLSIFGWRSLASGVTAADALPLMVRVVAYIAALFFVPSAILGCVSPIVVKLSLSDLQRSGTTVGKIYAWSTAGSIAGTFATGFYLISWFGTKTVVLLVATVLLVLALWFVTDRPARRAVWWGAGVLVAFGLVLSLLYGMRVLARECHLETNYFCIKVKDREGGEAESRVRELILDRLVHSYVDLEDPTRLVYGYERTYADVVAPVMERRPELSALFIGGGGYTFPRFLEAKLPDSHLVVTEIDPGVTEVVHQVLALPRHTRIVTHNMDARLYMVWEGRPGSFDLIFGDAFNDYSVPFHLTTLEFGRLVDDLLTPDGLYVANIIDGGKHGHFMRAFVRTLRQVFAHVEVIPTYRYWRETSRTTFVVVASQRPVDLSRLSPDMPALSQDELSAYLDMGPATILTDDYVPVDNLLAPLFVDSE